MTSTVSLRGVRKAFGDFEVIHGIDLDIVQGEFLVLVGPSGCGKSTLLRMIAGLEDVTAGTISINGAVVNDVDPRDRDIAMVFQSYALYPHMTVYNNLAFGLKLHGKSKSEISRMVETATAMLGLDGLLDRYPRQLSGGQRQRVAMGRAMVRDPKAFLFDEPLSNLDAQLRVQMRVEVKALHQRLKTTAIYVTHDQVEAMTMATRIGVLNAGELLQLGSPRDVYEQPNSIYVAARLGSPQINLLPAELVPGLAMPSGASTIGVRTEHLLISSPGDDHLPARVHRVEHLGDQTHVHLDFQGRSLVTLAGPHRSFAHDEPVGLRLVEPLFFDGEGKRIGAAA